MSWRRKFIAPPPEDTNTIYLGLNADEFNDSLQYAVIAALGEGSISHAFRMAVGDKALDYVRALFVRTGSDDEITNRVLAVLEEIDDEDSQNIIKHAVDRAFVNEIDKLVAEIVKNQIKESEHYKVIEAACCEQLRRWPALKDDEHMKLEVANTILKSFIR